MVTKKFAILGLDNAGKTSILTAFQKKYAFEEKIRQLTPTISVKSSQFFFLNHMVAFHDYGGQIRYRERYLENAEFYLADMDLVFYVIDAQDPARFLESFEYAEMILRYMESINRVIPVVICVHKIDGVDPDELEIIIEDWEANLAENFPAWYFAVAETSIFDAQSIVRVMAFSLSLFIPAYESIGEVLHAAREEVGGISALLFTLSGELLNEAYADGMHPDQQARLFNVIREDIAPFHRSKKLRALNKNEVLEFPTFEDYARRGVLVSDKYYVDLVFDPARRDRLDEVASTLRTQLQQLIEEIR